MEGRARKRLQGRVLGGLVHEREGQLQHMVVHHLQVEDRVARLVQGRYDVLVEEREEGGRVQRETARQQQVGDCLERSHVRRCLAALQQLPQTRAEGDRGPAVHGPQDGQRLGVGQQRRVQGRHLVGGVLVGHLARELRHALQLWYSEEVCDGGHALGDGGAEECQDLEGGVGLHPEVERGGGKAREEGLGDPGEAALRGVEEGALAAVWC
mmetsp:Transcript_3434/g.12071  ORF Transcript_3434/g.12071 Transcript_3434/m.12071 type:complete len:211 (+) Transcript_3434:890-1522(+)